MTWSGLEFEGGGSPFRLPPPAGRCGKCGRKTYRADMVGRRCGGYGSVRRGWRALLFGTRVKCRGRIEPNGRQKGKP